MGVNTESGPLRIKAKSVALARVNASGTQLLTSTPTAVIKNPSRRLSCMFSISFEPDAPQRVNSYVSSTWTARAMRPNRETKKTGELNLLVNGESLPDAYELDSAIREVRVTTSLAIPTAVGGATLPGYWVLLVEWEPNQPAMCLAEIDEIFPGCDATGPENVPVLAP